MVSPLEKIELRGEDPTGHGYYGAKRGSRKHKGLDLVAAPGDAVLSPIHGVVTKLGYPYANNLAFRYVEITNDTYRVWLMYVAPEVKVGDRVFEGQRVGEVQDIAGYWDPKMKNHVHYQVWKHGLLTDPEPLITAYGCTCKRSSRELPQV